MRHSIQSRQIFKLFVGYDVIGNFKHAHYKQFSQRGRQHWRQTNKWMAQKNRQCCMSAGADLFACSPNLINITGWFHGSLWHEPCDCNSRKKQPSHTQKTFTSCASLAILAIDVGSFFSSLIFICLLCEALWRVDRRFGMRLFDSKH